MPAGESTIPSNVVVESLIAVLNITIQVKFNSTVRTKMQNALKLISKWKKDQSGNTDVGKTYTRHNMVSMSKTNVLDIP